MQQTERSWQGCSTGERVVVCSFFDFLFSLLNFMDIFGYFSVLSITHFSLHLDLVSESIVPFSLDPVSFNLKKYNSLWALHRSFPVHYGNIYYAG